MCNVLDTSRWRRSALHLIKSLLALLLLATLLSGQAASTPPNNQQDQSKMHISQTDYAIANRQAVLSRAGNSDATRAVAREVFRNVGIPVEIADSFGYTDRVVRAQTAYLQGMHAPLHEQDVVTAVNNFAKTLGTPAWTNTTQQEVRKLRVRLFLSIPQLFVNENGALDAKGHRALLNQNIGPMEAAFIATTMLYMKTFYPEFQFTDAERAQYQSQGRAALAAEQRRREQLLLDIVQGRSTSTSVFDLLPAADHLFQDLGMPHAPTSAQTMKPVPAGQTADEKGGL